MGHNRQSELYAAALIPYAAAAVALVSRLAARLQSRHALVWEDILAVIAFVSGLDSRGDTVLTVVQSTGSAFTFISIYSM
jgi:hypothetical protein